jgi:hypothetical protein
MKIIEPRVYERRFLLIAGFCILAGCATGSKKNDGSSLAQTSYHGTDVEFTTSAGNEVSYFVRKKAVDPTDVPDNKVMASQLRVRSGSLASITTSWPAGNSGIFFGLSSGGKLTEIQVAGFLQPVSRKNGQRGIKVTVKVTTANFAGEALDFTIGPVIETSMRHIRDVRDYNTPHPEDEAKIRRDADSFFADRESIDHLTHSHLAMKALGGTSFMQDQLGRWHLRSSGPRPIELELEATTDEAPLTPVPIEEIVSAQVIQRSKPRQLQELAYLVYEEAVLAGADNYLTMFGRDNEFLLTIGADGLLPKAYEIVFASHFEAMRDDGNIAHEPSIGEFAISENIKAGKGPVRTPSFDYKMMDTRFLLAPSVVKYLEKVNPARAEEFFARKTSRGLSYKQVLLKNLRLIVGDAQPFAKNPIWKNLISLLPGVPNGQWRDSDSGLGGGRYPFDINVALMPGALGAVSQIARKMPDADFDRLALMAKKIHTIWKRDSWKFFATVLRKDESMQQVRSYGAQLGLSESLIRNSLTGGALESFPALSLDKHGQPVPILHSDGGFLLLYSDDVPPDRIEAILRTVTTLFPNGLFSPAGLFISNAAHAPADLRRDWDFRPYHGVVIWPWQEFLLVEGIAHQLARTDLSAETKSSLERTELQFWKMLYQTAPYLGLELYTGKPKGSALVPSPWAPKDSSGSAMIQAWSELGLLIEPPARVIEKLGEMPSGIGQRFSE